MKLIRYIIAIVLTGFFLRPVCAQQTPLESAREVNPPQAGYRGISLVFDSDRVFYLRPDDRVDAIVVFDRNKESSGKKKEVCAGTMLKMVSVLNIAPSEDNPGKTIVQLGVNPAEAQYLEAAAHSGDIWLSLRKKGDQNDHPLEFSAWSKVLKPGLLMVRPAHAPHSGGECATAACNRVLSGSGLADAPLLAAVESRMREDYPALSVPLARDKAIFIRPGDRIDLLATIDVSGPNGPKKHKNALTLLQNILVLDSRRSESQPGQGILLLAMNYNEVQYAALAWDTAEIQVLSRNRSDTEVHTMDPGTLERW